MRLEPETLDAYRAYLQSLSRNLGIQISEDAIKLLHEYSEGWPSYLIRILYELAPMNPDATGITADRVRPYRNWIQEFLGSIGPKEN